MGGPNRPPKFFLDLECYYSPMFAQIAQNITNLLFPTLCVGCKTHGQLICDQCFLKISFLYSQNCPVCRQPTIAGRTHVSCATPWGLDGLVSLTYFRGPIRPLIHQLKYRGVTILQTSISQLTQTYQQYEDLHLPPSIIIPIPLHKKSQNARGFNQAEIIADSLSSTTGYPQINDLLIRVKQTTSQTTLAKKDRQKNMRNAFQLKPGQQVKDASFILVDDVFTTGATLREAAKTLKRHGAKYVYAFTLAQD
jgi:ComF family protein